MAVARHIKYLQTYTRELQSISANVTAREGKCHPQTKLCFGCLRSNHLAKNCIRKVKCGIDGCTDNHHKLLHDVQTLQSKPSLVHNQKAIIPTAPAFSPRANPGQMSTPLLFPHLLVKFQNYFLCMCCKRMFFSDHSP